MTRELNTLSDFLKSKQIKNTLTQFSLVLLLNSTVLVVKNSLFDAKNFYWPDTLNLSISMLIIFFMGFYKNKNVYEEWKKSYLNYKNSFLLILIGLAGTMSTYFLNRAYVTYKDNFDFSSFFEFPAILFVANKILFLGSLIMDFLAYFSFSVFLMLIYLPILINLFEYLEEYLDNIFVE